MERLADDSAVFLTRLSVRCALSLNRENLGKCWTQKFVDTCNSVLPDSIVCEDGSVRDSFKIDPNACNMEWRRAEMRAFLSDVDQVYGAE